MDAWHYLKRIFTAAAILELSVALLDITGGGFAVNVAGIRISSQHAFRPFSIGVICASLAIWLNDRVTPGASLAWLRLKARRVALGVAILTFAIGIIFGARVAGGADSYGYISEAYLWAHGSLVVLEPLAAIDPVVTPAAAPLGYRLAAPGTIVPIYSPGYPMLMGAASIVGGAKAMYLVVPILGAVTVWLTYWLGTRIGDPLVGLSAAIVFACSPIFVFQLFVPMSDVPVTAWWLLAIGCAVAGQKRTAFLAGLSAGAAVLTRPNLVPLTIAVAAMVWLESPSSPPERSRFRRLGAFAAGVVPACVAVALINNALYGAPMVSGYGGLNTLFKSEWIRINLARYPLWLIQVHSPGILLAGAAPFLLARRPADDPWPLRISLLLMSFCVMVLLCYVSYVPMDGWPFVRFLLPAIPLVFILASVVVLRAVDLAPPAFRGALIVAVVGLAAGNYVAKAEQLGAFATAANEQRFIDVGAYVARELPPNAVVLAGMHSGSLRMYGHRPTLRWDQIAPGDLDAVIRILQGRGFELFIVLESDEEPFFRERFSPASQTGTLNWTPRFIYNGLHTVRLYSITDLGT